MIPRTRERLVEAKRRKNFLPTFIITIFLWAAFATLIYFVDPESTLALITFFALVFVACLFTLSIIFANTRRGLLGGSAITIFLILRYFGVGNFINLILLIGILVTLEIYFIRRN